MNVHPSSVTFEPGPDYTLSSTGGFGIAGSAGITLNGSGTITLQTANTFTGPVAVNAGILKVQNNAALGTSSGVTVASGATLQLDGSLGSGIAVGAIPLTLSGAGATGQAGALVSRVRSNSYGGLLSLGATRPLRPTTPLSI